MAPRPYRRVTLSVRRIKPGKQKLKEESDGNIIKYPKEGTCPIYPKSGILVRHIWEEKRKILSQRSQTANLMFLQNEEAKWNP